MSARLVKIGEAGYDVYIGRGGKWGNPFIIGIHGNRSKVIALYEEWVRKQPNLIASLPELRGKVLGCFCSPFQMRTRSKSRVTEGYDTLPSILQETMV